MEYLFDYVAYNIPQLPSDNSLPLTEVYESKAKNISKKY